MVKCLKNRNSIGRIYTTSTEGYQALSRSRISDSLQVRHDLTVLISSNRKIHKSFFARDSAMTYISTVVMIVPTDVLYLCIGRISGLADGVAKADNA